MKVKFKATKFFHFIYVLGCPMLINATSAQFLSLDILLWVLLSVWFSGKCKCIITQRSLNKLKLKKSQLKLIYLLKLQKKWRQIFLFLINIKKERLNFQFILGLSSWFLMFNIFAIILSHWWWLLTMQKEIKKRECRKSLLFVGTSILFYH